MHLIIHKQTYVLNGPHTNFKFLFVVVFMIIRKSFCWFFFIYYIIRIEISNFLVDLIYSRFSVREKRNCSVKLDGMIDIL